MKTTVTFYAFEMEAEEFIMHCCNQLGLRLWQPDQADEP